MEPDKKSYLIKIPLCGKSIPAKSLFLEKILMMPP